MWRARLLAGRAHELLDLAGELLEWALCLRCEAATARSVLCVQRLEPWECCVNPGLEPVRITVDDDCDSSEAVWKSSLCVGRYRGAGVNRYRHHVRAGDRNAFNRRRWTFQMPPLTNDRPFTRGKLLTTTRRASRRND